VNALSLSSKGKYRLCMDLSGDLCGTVNSFIGEEESSVTYTSTDEVVECVLRNGRGALISKLDLGDAYKMVPVHPWDIPLLGIRWRSLYFVATRLVFGLRSAAKIFNNVSTAMEIVLVHLSQHEEAPERLVPYVNGVPLVQVLKDSFEVRHLLDNFIFISLPFEGLANHLFDRAIQLFEFFGLPFSPNSRQIVFGIGMDTVLSEFYIPADKVAKALSGVRNFQSQNAPMTKRDCQRLIGFLSVLARALVAARTFLRRLIDAICGVKNQDDVITLDGGVAEDLAWWENVLLNRQTFALCFLPSKKRFPQEHLLASDSSFLACGGTFANKWFSLEFPASMRKVITDIAVKEFAALALTVLVWGTDLAGSRLVMECDNQAVIAILFSGSSKNPVLMSLMRFFVLECLRLNVVISPVYVRSAKNIGPDLLSRMKVVEFFRFNAAADREATPVINAWRGIYDACLVSFYKADVAVGDDV
jgi:hypothetical protein